MDIIDGPKVVVIGGGTGQSIFLRGLKQLTENITAVVAVTDDGGGSGKLREDLGMLPPGDIRNCIIALADIEPEMKKVMQYRFPDGEYKGQSFGNLFIAALNGVYGSFEKAISKISQILAVKGKVLPVSADNLRLYAELENGNIVKGEAQIPLECIKQRSGIKRVFLDVQEPKALDEVIDAISCADIIVIGPGSLYTSIVPNILIPQLKNAILQSNALKVYVCNIMTQPGETDGFDVLKHVVAIFAHSCPGLFNYVIVNNGCIPSEYIEKYKNDNASVVGLDKRQTELLREKNVRVITGDFVKVKKGYIRHDAYKLASLIIDLFQGVNQGEKGI